MSQSVPHRTLGRTPILSGRREVSWFAFLGKYYRGISGPTLLNKSCSKYYFMILGIFFSWFLVFFVGFGSLEVISMEFERVRGHSEARRSGFEALGTRTGPDKGWALMDKVSRRLLNRCPSLLTHNLVIYLWFVYFGDFQWFSEISEASKRVL